MMKAVGVLLVWGGCVLWGLRASAALRQRGEVLEDIAQGLEQMERELSLNRMALPELLTRVSNRTTQQGELLFKSCCVEIEKGNTFTYSWNKALEKSALMQKDRALLAGLSGLMGRYEADGQVQALLRLRGMLDRHIDLVRRQAQSIGKVYGILGMTVGGFLSLMLV